MSKRVQSLMLLNNDPDTTKIKLIASFKRRQAFLDMKKKKTISRYSHFVKESPTTTSKCDPILKARINLIETEIIQLERRYDQFKFQITQLSTHQYKYYFAIRIERLKLEDGFNKNITK